MTTRDLITQALRDHSPLVYTSGNDICCSCQFNYLQPTIPWSPEHVANAIIAAVPHWRRS